MCPESCARFVLVGDSYLMVTRLQVYAAEYSCTLQLVHQLVNSWKCIPVLDGLAVQCPEILHQAKITVRLVHEQDSSTIRRSAWLYQVPVQQVINMSVHLCQLLGAQVLQWAERWFRPWLYWDSVR